MKFDKADEDTKEYLEVLKKNAENEKNRKLVIQNPSNRTNWYKFLEDSDQEIGMHSISTYVTFLIFFVAYSKDEAILETQEYDDFKNKKKRVRTAPIPVPKVWRKLMNN